MKAKYVKTSNQDRFAEAIKAVEKRGSREACIMLVSGEPGTGKTAALDNYGARRDALYIEGMPGIDLRYVRDYVADQTGVKFAGKFDQDKALVRHFRRSKQPIILDECQHGLSSKAQVVEWLRRIAEQSDVILVLACHTAELYRFGQPHMAHISSRVTARAEFNAASLDDTAIFLSELCEVGLEDGIYRAAYQQSSGRYRLLMNAGVTLEGIAAQLGKDRLKEADVKGYRLCEDALRIGKARAAK